MMPTTEARILVLATLPIAIGAAWLAGLRQPEPMHAATAQRAAITSAQAQRAVPSADEGWLGVIVSGYSADIGAEVGGTVSETWITVGARVKAGAPLLRIDESVASGDVRAARAKLEQQRSLVARAEADLAEASDLVARLQAVPGGVSDRQMLAARTRVQQGEAALREAEAGIGVHEADVGQQLSRSHKHVIRAPFDGIAVERFVDPGALVVPGQVVARIINGDYYVRFAMPPEAARGQAVGQSVHVELDGRSIDGIVSDIQPEVDGASQLVFARARLTVAKQDTATVVPTVMPAVMPGARVRVRPQVPGPMQRGG
jgi:RND family efflux transporter MFP subunit